MGCIRDLSEGSQRKKQIKKEVDEQKMLGFLNGE